MTTRVALIEHLGRGGIAQTSESWRQVLEEAGHRAQVISRPSAYWESAVTAERRLPGVVGALDQHRRFVRAVIAEIEGSRPDVVLIQNYLVPGWEVAIVRASRAVGAKVVTIVHNHEPHDRWSGLRRGLGSLLRESDYVVAHTEYVGRYLVKRYGVRVEIIGHPAPLVVLDAEEAELPDLARGCGEPIVATFGGLKRRYKNAEFFSELPSLLPHGIRFIAAGPGARSGDSRVEAVSRFISDGELLWLARRSSVVVLPYRAATQSGAVVLAQNAGALPLASAVGGIPEQIIDGESGALMRPDATPEDWAEEILRQLRRVEGDAGWRTRRVTRARREHVDAASSMLVLLGELGGMGVGCTNGPATIRDRREGRL